MTEHTEAVGVSQAAQSAQTAGSHTVHRLTVDGREVVLVGTAHLSTRSAEEVERVIAADRPDSVCVELCETRYQALMRHEDWREMDLFQVVRRKRATMLLVHLVLSAFQRRLGDHLGVRPGAEMVAAVQAAERGDAEVVLADRSIQVTLARTWRLLTWWDKARLLVSLLTTLLLSPRLSEADIEALKEQDMLSQVMGAFAESFPRAKRTLIDERDHYLAEKIRTAPGERVVAVVGAGHLEGIRRRLLQPAASDDLAPLLYVPPAAISGKAIQWAVPLLVLGLLAWGFVAGGAAASWAMIQVWVFANGILAALGAALALAHPLTIAVAFVSAPLTSLNPMLAAGWVAGLCEVLVRKPRVKDFETLPADIVTLRGFWRNGVTRVLLVVALANLGSTLGTVIGIPMMSALLG